MRKTLGLLPIMFMCLFLAACGSATEVGNPTGDIPRTITGVIDEATITDLSLDATKAEDFTESVAGLNVYAFATDGTSVESPVDTAGAFSLEAFVGKTYALSVRVNTMTIGNFSFEENDEGNRGNSFSISDVGEAINLGICVYANGSFVPEFEPRRYHGVNSPGGGGNGQAGN